ncbi:hypothetical protein [Caldimonas brevitalea]|nr:hypothetical protein [Caldimonas brevitalea]
MTPGKTAPPRLVPTLTEVVRPVPEPAPLPVELLAEAVPSPALDAVDEERLVNRVLADLQQQVELTLEFRLRETLTPALGRMADQLIRDTRVELASTLREVIGRAVAHELSRQKAR